jgi:hypothetical protein
MLPRAMFISSMRDKNMPKDVDNIGPTEHAGLIGKIQREKLKRKAQTFVGKILLFINREDNTTTLKTHSRHETSSLG